MPENITGSNDRQLKQILTAFFGTRRIRFCEPFGNGHINDTFRVCMDGPPGEDLYVLQRINRKVFTNPPALMDNVCAVTSWIAGKIAESGGDVKREVLTFLPAGDGKYYFVDPEGEYWRVSLLIDEADCFETAVNDDVFYQSAAAFGRFQRQLADFPAKTLFEVIPGFHNTPVRYQTFEASVERDAAGRAAGADFEIRFLTERRALAGRLTQALTDGRLPLRVTHNDTKLNNIMIDRKTGKALCVLDLDTVMPGLSVTDFGDAIRFGASTAAEDEPDLGKVHFDRHLYEVYRNGFIEGCHGALTPEEIRMLPDGAMVITYEQALRFLSDYLDGDIYYKISRPGQNLDRARTQIHLLQEMEEALN